MPVRFAPIEPWQIRRALEAIAEWLAERDLPLVIIGGVAAQVYGFDHLTQDVDVLTESGRLALLRDELKGTPRRYLTFGGVRVDMRGVPVDVVSRQDELRGLYDEALVAALHGPRVKIGRRLYRVAPVDYLVVMKLAAFRAKDLAAVAELLNTERVDLQHVRDILSQHAVPGGPRRLARAIREAARLQGEIGEAVEE